MAKIIMKILKQNVPLGGILLVCLVYWSYLMIHSQMVIHHDAIGYERLGSKLYQEGFASYFKHGLSREPLYPMTIAFSMKAGEFLGLSYQLVQKALQVFFLLSSQLLLFYLLTQLRISKGIKFLVVGYFGISPAMVNAAFSLYSEIVALPFVLLLLMGGVMAWGCGEASKRTVGKAIILTSIGFVGACFVKGIFQYIFVIFMLPFFGRLCVRWGQRATRAWRQCLVYIISVTLILGSFLLGYRLINKVFNNNFDFTNRYDVLLYGNASKRTVSMDSSQFWAHVAAIPGEGFCRKFFTEEQCRYCGFQQADKVRGKELPALVGGVTPDEQHQKTLWLAFEAMKRRPAQYLFLTFLECFKMGFWESTHIGFVDYPPLLTRLFNNKIFSHGIRLGISLMTQLSLLWLWGQMLFGWKLHRKNMNSRFAIILFLFFIINSFTAFYALFSILTRFAFPIVPLYFLTVALFLDQVLVRGRQKEIQET